MLFGKKNSEIQMLPKYMPFIHLVDEAIMINPDKYFDYEKLDAYYSPNDANKINDDGTKGRIHKTFDRSKKIQVTTKIVICWKNNYIFECYELQKAIPVNFPVQYTKNFLFFSSYIHEKVYEQYDKLVLSRKEIPINDLKMFERILFYPITCTAVSSKNIY